MIPALAAMKAIGERRGDAVVVSTTVAMRQWGQVSDRRDLDIDLFDCMDKAPTVALGVALARPQRKVLVLDCDSTLRMNLAGLNTVGNAAPENLVHFLLEDADNISTDGRPIVGLERINLSSLAESAGYARVHRFDDLEDLVIGLEEVMEASGPTFVALRVVHDGDLRGEPVRSLADSFHAVRKSLRQSTSATPPGG